MNKNLTQEYKLVEEITNKSWFANPAGRQGYEVVLLQIIGDGGTRYYTSLGPGQTLSFTERLVGNFSAMAVDIRRARSFDVSGAFDTNDRGRKITFNARVQFHVTDARIVAMETVDPLGELHAKVVSALNRNLQRYSEQNINTIMIENIIKEVGSVPMLGLEIDGADVQDFTKDERLTQRIVTKEDTLHELEMQDVLNRAKIQAENLEHNADLERRNKLHTSIDLSNMNVFLHENPKLIPQVLAVLSEKEIKLLDAHLNVVQASVAEYIDQQKAIDGEIKPLEIAQIMRDAVDTKMTLSFGDVQDTPLIEWGEPDTDESEQPTKTNPREKKSKKKNNNQVNFRE